MDLMNCEEIDDTAVPNLCTFFRKTYYLHTTFMSKATPPLMCPMKAVMAKIYLFVLNLN